MDLVRNSLCTSAQTVEVEPEAMYEHNSVFQH